MATKRKRGADYRREYKELERRMASLDVYARNRVLELSKIHPDAVITASAKGKDVTKKWIELLPTKTIIFMIEKIEKWSANKENVTQLSIDEIYNDTHDILKN
jgi:hypothetical protein